MNTEDFIRELKHVEEQYKNRPTPTFEINISCMARDCRKHIEFLNEQIEKMKNCRNCKNWNWKHNKCEKKLKGDCFKNNKWELAE